MERDLLILPRFQFLELNHFNYLQLMPFMITTSEWPLHLKTPGTSWNAIHLLENAPGKCNNSRKPPGSQFFVKFFEIQLKFDSSTTLLNGTQFLSYFVKWLFPLF